MQKNCYDKFLNILKILEDHMQDASLCQAKIDKEICSMDGSLGHHHKDINQSRVQVNNLVDRLSALEDKVIETKKVNCCLEHKVLELEVIVEDQARIQEDMQAKITHLEVGCVIALLGWRFQR